MTSKDNIIYYTITAVVFIGVVLISLLFHNRGQPINGDSDKGFMTENIIAISPFVTAAATVVLGLITWRYVRLTREILKATNKPEILIFLHPADRFPSINLCIQNIGTGFASKIMFTGDLAFRPTTLHSIPLKDIGIFKNGIDYLGPEKKLEIPLFYTQHGWVTRTTNQYNCYLQRFSQHRIQGIVFS
ncbi:MAG: hypothetical protein OXI61_12370 [Candidatus Poribacteria bacterium]|nr:hypothetical protein [Candidatus Poribacteria bacterium]